MSLRKTTLMVAGLLAALGAIWAITARPSPAIMVSDAEAMVVASSQSVMITLSVRNDGAPDRMIEARSDIAKLTVLKSPRSRGLPVPAASTIALTGEGGHVMMMGVQTALEEGTLLPLSLHFENAGTIATKARVTAMSMDHGQAQEIAPGEPAPTIALKGAAEGDGWHLTLGVRNFRFAKDLVDGPHVPGTGHAHVYVEGAKIGRLFETEARLGALPSGRHMVEAALYTNDHKAYHANGQPVAAQWEIVVP